ncbi:helix-turn-helix domain-containing protein [Microbacterium sp.]|uniref:helix-turn-helix domain-containing protein n=1 Tax=Microbacterium sp. TaxID=51671 RepID=UPI002811C028|nr:helix-turn-helix domain-containing protein [Microbacterium sp.]
MSLNAYIWAADLPLARCNGTAHRVLLKLADRADDLGYGAYPGVQSIADSLQCSTRTVQRAIRELLDAGLIRVGDQRYVEHFDPRYRPTVYDVLTWALLYAEEHGQGPESRGDNRVTPGAFRGDTNRHPGVTTGVAISVLKPSYQDSSSHLTLVSARESDNP